MGTSMDLLGLSLRCDTPTGNGTPVHSSYALLVISRHELFFLTLVRLERRRVACTNGGTDRRSCVDPDSMRGSFVSLFSFPGILFIFS